MDRETLLQNARQFWRERAVPDFVPGESYVPVSGKVLDEEDLALLVDASLDMWLTAGRFATSFGKQLARRVGVRKALLTVSGSAANLLAFSALTSRQLGAQRIEAGSEVITVAAGFPTTVNPIVQNRCIPVFVDVDVHTHNVDVAHLEAALSERTRAVFLAHTLGNPFDLGAVRSFCQRHDLFLIEDCCDALGAAYAGQAVGTFGKLATLSFYPAHHITTGEGGAVLTDAPELARIVESFRDWGRDCWCEPGKDNTCGKRYEWELGTLPAGYDHKYVYSHIGYNLKMTDMQAAVGLGQLGKLDAFVETRRRNHGILRQAFAALGLDDYFVLPQATPNSDPSWFGFVLSVRPDSGLERNAVVRYLEAHKVGTRLVFAGDLTRQPAYEGVAYRVAGELSGTDFVLKNSFWIGCWPGLTQPMLEYILDVFQQMIREML